MAVGDAKTSNNAGGRVRRSLSSLHPVMNSRKQPILVLTGATLLTALALILLIGAPQRSIHPSQPSPTKPPKTITFPSDNAKENSAPLKDRFGTTELNPTAAGGVEWSSN